MCFLTRKWLGWGKTPGPAASAVCRGQGKPAWRGADSTPQAYPGTARMGGSPALPKRMPLASKVHSRNINSFSTLLQQPLAVIPTHGIRLCLLPYPPDEAVCPRHSPRGRAGRTNAACLPSRVSLHWHGTAAQHGEGASFTPPLHESRS